MLCWGSAKLLQWLVTLILSYSVSKYFCLHCGTIVPIRLTVLSGALVFSCMCARSICCCFFNRRHQTRHAKNCGAIYVLYVCAQHPICMYNDNNDKINDQLPYLYIADALNDDETQSTAWNESSFSNLNYPFQLSENETEPLFQVHIRDRRQTSPGMIQTHTCMLKYSHLNHGIHFW